MSVPLGKCPLRKKSLEKRITFSSYSNTRLAYCLRRNSIFSGGAPNFSYFKTSGRRFLARKLSAQLEKCPLRKKSLEKRITFSSYSNTRLAYCLRRNSIFSGGAPNFSYFKTSGRRFLARKLSAQLEKCPLRKKSLEKRITFSSYSNTRLAYCLRRNSIFSGGAPNFSYFKTSGRRFLARKLSAQLEKCPLSK